MFFHLESDDVDSESDTTVENGEAVADSGDDECFGDSKSVQKVTSVSSLKSGDWLAVEYDRKWFVCVVENVQDEYYVMVKFMQPNGPNTKFNWPTKDDKLLVSLEQIVGKLVDAPMPFGSRFFKITQRVSDRVEFLFGDFL